MPQRKCARFLAKCHFGPAHAYEVSYEKSAARRAVSTDESTSNPAMPM